MPDWLTQISAFGVFLAIAVVGFVFALVSLIFGEVSDLFHADVDHDVGGDYDHGPSFFSPRVLAVFVTAFGATGAIAVRYGFGPLPASAMGMLSGFVFGYLILQFARFLYSQQASSDVRSADVVGQQARVVIAIPAGGVGQVRCKLGEELIDRIARTRDGQPVPENAVVMVEEVLGETVIVSRK